MTRRIAGWSLRAALCLSVSLGQVAPLAAQDLDASDELEQLIPDSAVLDPETWAADGSGETAPGDEDAAEDLDDTLDAEAEADFSALDGELERLANSEANGDEVLALDQPDGLSLPPIDELEPEEDVQFATFDDVIPPIPAGSEEQVSSELVLVFPTDMSLFPVRDEFIDRFKKLSAVEDLDDNGSQAMLAAQARADEDLLQRMLRVYGYFDGQVIRSVTLPEGGDSADPDRAVARFDVIPGPRYTVGTVDMGMIEQAIGDDVAALRASYKVNPGDLLSIDAIADGRYLVDIELGERGYPFATIDDPSLLVDHARKEGDVTLPVTPNGRYVFGQVTSNDERFLSGHHLSDIARFHPGDLYQRSMEMDLRRAILATGLVGSVTMTPVETAPPQGDQPGTVDMAVELTRAPLRTIEGSLGYGSQEGFRAAASWEHRNLFPPEGMLRVRGVAGTQEQLAGTTLRFNNFKGRDRVLTIDAYASNMDNDAFDAETVSLIGTYEQLSTLLFQRELSYGGGLELVLTNERDNRTRIAPGAAPRETYMIAALPAHVQWDTSDDLLDPSEGFRTRLALSPEYSRFDNTNSTYLKVQFDLSYYQPMGDRVVLAARTRLGSIYGAGLENVAPSRRFYAGGGGSVRGYGYRAIGPRDVLGEPNGGRSLVELSVEARVRTGLFDDSLSVVPFADFGTVARGPTPDLDALRMGVGVGVRYHTGFGPIRLDVGVPLNRQPGDAPVAVYVALGQAF